MHRILRLSFRATQLASHQVKVVLASNQVSNNSNNNKNNFSSSSILSSSKDSSQNIDNSNLTVVATAAASIIEDHLRIENVSAENIISGKKASSSSSSPASSSSSSSSKSSNGDLHNIISAAGSSTITTTTTTNKQKQKQQHQQLQNLATYIFHLIENFAFGSLSHLISPNNNNNNFENDNNNTRTLWLQLKSLSIQLLPYFQKSSQIVILAEIFARKAVLSTQECKKFQISLGKDIFALSPELILRFVSSCQIVGATLQKDLKSVLEVSALNWVSSAHVSLAPFWYIIADACCNYSRGGQHQQNSQNNNNSSSSSSSLFFAISFLNFKIVASS